jgi:hypothetical protein
MAPPAWRGFWGKLLLHQKIDTNPSGCYAAEYLITGSVDGSGDLSTVYISKGNEVGPRPITSVTIAVSSVTSFAVTISNIPWASTITGFWDLEMGWDE